MEGDNKEPMLKLDGSAGMGGTAKLTLTTKDDVDGEKDETFVFPLALINLEMLAKAVQFNLILGYRIKRTKHEDSSTDDKLSDLLGGMGV